MPLWRCSWLYQPTSLPTQRRAYSKSEKASLSDSGRIGQRLLGYGYLLFRWRDQEKGARHFAWVQRPMRLQLQLGSAQTQCSLTANTCANLLKMWPALWTFLHNPLVAPTNNAAERALRDYVTRTSVWDEERAAGGSTAQDRQHWFAHVHWPA